MDMTDERVDLQSSHPISRYAFEAVGAAGEGIENSGSSRLGKRGEAPHER
jgi:hypothetical protein